MSVIRIGSRGSKLALVQTNRVVSLLKEHGFEAEVVVISTRGDSVTNCSLHEAGGIGLFVHELDMAILDGRIDAAVHSMKDIPLERPAGLVTAAVLKRDSPFDFLAVGKPMAEVFRIGTSSLRRRAQFLRYFTGHPEMHVADLRGNVDTRLSKLASGEFDAVVLAEAALQRLGLSVNGFRLCAEDFVPSANQGAIAVVSRDCPELLDVFSRLNDAETAFCTSVERAVMEELGAGCFTPAGAYCQGNFLVCEVLSLDGERAERVTARVLSLSDAHAAGRLLAEKARELLDEARAKIEGV